MTSKRKRFPTGKAVALGTAGALAYFLFRGNAAQKKKSGQGTPGGTDDLGEPFYEQYVIPYGPESQQQEQSEPIMEPQQLLEVSQPTAPFANLVEGRQQGLEPNFTSAMFGAVNTTPSGFVPVTNEQGAVVGGYDERNQQSVAFTNMSYDPSAEALNLASFSPAPAPAGDAVAGQSSQDQGFLGTGITLPQFGLLGLGFSGSYGTAVGSEIVKPSSAEPFATRAIRSGIEDAPFGKSAIKAVAPEAGEAVGKGILKTTAKTGTKAAIGAVPIVGTVAGAEFDVAVDNRPRVLAYGANILGDILGGAAAAITSPAAATGVGVAVPIAAGVGGQILGEQIVYKPYDWIFGKDDDDVASVGLEGANFSTLSGQQIQVETPTSFNTSRGSSGGGSGNARIGADPTLISEWQSKGATQQQIQSFFTSGKTPVIQNWWRIDKGVYVDRNTGKLFFSYDKFYQEQFKRYGVESQKELIEKYGPKYGDKLWDRIRERGRDAKDDYKHDKRRGRYDDEVNKVRSALGKSKTSYERRDRSKSRATTTISPTKTPTKAQVQQGQYSQEQIKNLNYSPAQTSTPANANFSHESGAKVYVAPPTKDEVKKPTLNYTPANFTPT